MLQRNNSMCWSLNSMPMASRGAAGGTDEDQRKRAEQRLCSEQQRLMAGDRLLRESRDRAAFYPQPVQQRVTSAPKPEYHPPPAHSRAGGSTKAGEKPTLQPTTLPKAEPNFSMFGYPPYQSMGFISQHDAAKMKGAAPCKEPPTSLPNPPPLMSDVKNSVIVKNDGKISHLEVSQVKTAPPPHSPSPKLQAHYVPPSTQARQGYEYRSPSQSPHHLSQRHTPSPLHHRTQVQQPQPHRQSPDQRYRTYGTPAKPATMANYPYPTLVTTAAHYIPVPGVNVTPGSKPKVSSPAPPHIYGMPTAGISTGVPVCRPDVSIGTSMPLPLTSKAPVASSLSPSPYQQMSHGHQPPHPSQPSIGGHPPPAHSKVTYETRLYSPGLKQHTNLPPQQGSSPPAATVPHLQPLDLGVSANREETSSPKRKSVTPQHSPVSALDISKKRPRLDTSSAQLARPQDSPIAVSASPVPRTCSGDGSVRPSSTGSSSGIAVLPVSLTPPQRNSPAPSPNPPGTPGKQTLVDSDKSNSPGPPATKPSNYQVHKLKKAWLQRHSGEDGSEDTTGVVGSGSCVTLPLTIAPTPVVMSRENSVVGSGIANLLQNVGTMAMSSICKPKSNSGSKGNGRKGQVGKDGGTTFNGHGSDISGKMQQGDTSSSSDQERESKTPPKRKPPKVKRKKGANALRKAAAEELKRKKLSTSMNLSESASDSDKESGSEKDTDSGGSAKKSSSTAGSGSGPCYSGNKEPRKRGRRPKSKNERGEEPRQKKPREDPSAPQRDPFRKPPVSQLKKTGETFLQDGPCFEVAPKLGKCRECRWTPNQRSKNMPNIFCRFYAFRRLRYTKNGQLAIAGFSDPHRDASEDDLKLWLPRANSKPSDLDLYVSHFVLAQVGDQFCHVVEQEKECLAVHMSEESIIAWKRVVQGVREMCDVCETTLFNYHWACGKCGFVVCIDCYKSRKAGTSKSPTDMSRDKDDFAWLLCTNRQPHEQEKLMLTQIIAGDSLMQVGRRLHDVRIALGISQFCGCRMGDEPLLKGSNGICKESMGSGDSDVEPDKDGKYSTLRKLLIRPSHKHNGNSSRASSPAKSKKQRCVQLDVVTSSPECKPPQVGTHVEKDVQQSGIKKIMELRQFIRRFRGYNRNIPLRPRIMTLTESTKLYPGVPHSWLCNGWLLRLHDPNHIGNYGIFQVLDGFDHMGRRLKDDRSNPMVLKLKDWPTGEDFAEMLPARFSDLMKALPLAEYTHRTGRLNLASRLPECFVRPDLGPKMYNAYGMAQSQNTSKGTTNLHLDISDAVNVMVYVGITKDGNQDEYIKEAFQAIEESCCDIFTKKRVLEENEVPGALWHIYSAQDADKIRDLLNQVSLERGVRLEAHHDPIHDQSWYLDKKLRDRLYVEYGVQSHSIVQCLGDSIFIPAGAPHQGGARDQSRRDVVETCYCGVELMGNDFQVRDRWKTSWILLAVGGSRLLIEQYNPTVGESVTAQRLWQSNFFNRFFQVRNLHNCIKVAEDFVSPENVSHCFHMTQEFRCLSNTHTNHEDKLQIKNIIYHAVKDSLSVISSAIAMAKEEYISVTDGLEASAITTTAAEQLIASNGDSKEDAT
ncbi:hypothetical protein PR048_016315 [Dryococelus australis]|uniref:JmjC domain-containing protein n=1 Tax=Dryococelus australis TaxID=614101 RepID=A0ABQ9HJD9_9NEOP|nr:hypothetical protein PR048_016315 [Dryococelus australis]